MKLTRKQLRNLVSEVSQEITEGCDDKVIVQPIADSESAPCPHSTAEDLKASGMSESEVLQWVNTMLTSFLSEGEFNLAGDVGMLSGDESFVVV